MDDPRQLIERLWQKQQGSLAGQDQGAEHDIGWERLRERITEKMRMYWGLPARIGIHPLVFCGVLMQNELVRLCERADF